MFPILFEIGPVKIWTYGFALTIATLVTSFLIWRRSRKLGFNEEHIIDMVLFSLFFALIFARVSYVLGHGDQFGSVLRILLVTYFPGLDGAFGLLGGMLGFFLYTFLRKWPLLRLFDCIAMGVSLGIAIVMVGAFFAGSYVGTPSTAPWGVLLPGYPEYRHPIALYYAVWNLGIYILIVLLDRVRRKDGFLAGIFFVLIGIALIWFDWYTLGGLTIANVHLTQVIGFLGIMFGIFLLYRAHRSQPPRFEQNDHSMYMPT
jgi:phosphatidylglycerol:prolipoprotein diacylglycerol transferase